MSKSELFEKHGIPYFIGLLITYSLEKLLVASLFFEDVYGFDTILVVVIWTIIYSGMNNRKIFRVEMSIVIPIFLLYFVGIGQRIIPVFTMLKYDYFIMVIKWGLRYIAGGVPFIPKGADVYMTILLFMLISGLVSWVISKKKSTIIMILFGGLFIIEWFRYIGPVMKYFNLFLAGIILYSFYKKYFDVVTRAKDKGQVIRFFNYDTVMTYGLVMAVVVVLLANIVLLFTPISVINSKLGNRIPNIAGIRSDYPQSRGAGNVFSFSSTMYQPNEYLGGALQVNLRDTVMLVDSEVENLRLRGRVKNVYTGNQWTNDNLIYKNNIGDQELYGELVDDVSGDYIRTKIYATNIATTTIFAPYKYVASSEHIAKIYGNEDNIQFFKRANLQANPKEYVVVSRIENPGYEEIADEKFLKYLTLPQNYSPEVIKLTKEIIGAEQDPFKKIKKIEKYLRVNYDYALVVGNVSQFDDFVEHFLLEEKKGYCVYFASAMAVMGRVADVPTRYVEGYVLPSTKNYDGLYDVKANRAHAWVEAYIPGMGWINLEATPAYPADLLEEETIDQPVSVESTENQGQEERAFEDPLEDIGEGFGDGVVDPKITKGNIVVIGIISLVLLAYVVILVAQQRSKKRWQGLSTRGKAVVLIRRKMKLLGYFSGMSADKSLPNIFIRKMAKDYLLFSVSDDIIETIDKVLYSDGRIGESEVVVLEKSLLFMYEKTRERIGFVRHYAVVKRINMYF